MFISMLWWYCQNEWNLQLILLPWDSRVSIYLYFSLSLSLSGTYNVLLLDWTWKEEMFWPSKRLKKIFLWSWDNLFELKKYAIINIQCKPAVMAQWSYMYVCILLRTFKLYNFHNWVKVKFKYYPVQSSIIIIVFFFHYGPS